RAHLKHIRLRERLRGIVVQLPQSGTVFVASCLLCHGAQFSWRRVSRAWLKANPAYHKDDLHYHICRGSTAGNIAVGHSASDKWKEPRESERSRGSIRFIVPLSVDGAASECRQLEEAALHVVGCCERHVDLASIH